MVARDPLGLAVPTPRRHPRGLPLVRAALAALVLISAFTIVPLVTVVDLQSRLLRGAESARLQALAERRADAVSIWLERRLAAGRMLAAAEPLRRYAAETAIGREVPMEPGPAGASRRNLERTIADLVRRERLLDATLIALDGRPLLGGSVSTPRATGGVERLIRSVEAGRSAVLVPAGGGEAAAVVKLLVPVPPPAIPTPRGRVDRASEPVAILVMSLPVAGELSALLDAASGGGGERFRLIQTSRRSPPEATPDGPVEGASNATSKDGPRVVADGRDVVAARAPVAGLPWTVLAEIDAASVRGPLGIFARRASIVAGLGGLALLVTFIAFAWRHERSRRRALGRQYRRLVRCIRCHRHLLDSIGHAMDAMLGVKAIDGRYGYVNPAFAAMLGRPAEDLLGRTDVELLGPAAAPALAADDARVLDGFAVRTTADEIPIAGRRRRLVASKLRVCDETGRPFGQVVVARDAAGRVARQPQPAALDRHPMEALNNALLRCNPDLLAHVRRVRRWALALGARHDLDRPELARLELAAVVVPLCEALLPEASRVGDAPQDDRRIERAHQRALRALELAARLEPRQRADQDRAAERHDDTSAPLGGPSASLTGILTLAEAYGALIAPRDGRARPSIGEALYRLAKHPVGFDTALVPTLADVVDREPSEPARSPEPDTPPAMPGPTVDDDEAGVRIATAA